MSVVVVFAVEDEFAPWRRLRRFHRTEVGGACCYRASVGDASVFVTFTGVGARRIEHVSALAGLYKATAGIAAGLAGGLKPQWRPEDVLAAEEICHESRTDCLPADPTLLRVATRCGAKPVQRFVTLERIARTAEEKSRLARLADAAEMESLPVMKQFSRDGVPAVAIRAIADTSEMDMPFDFEATLDAKGQVRILRLLGQLARSPQKAPGLVRFGLTSRRAAVSLTSFLDRFIEQLVGQQSIAAKRPVAVAG